MSEPTAREFEALTQSMRELTSEMRQLPERFRVESEKLRAENAETYARKDVIGPRLDDIEKDVEKHGSYFQWIVYTVVGAVMLALLAGLLAQNGVMR